MAGVLRTDFEWPDERVRSAVRIVARVAGRKGIVVPHTRIRAVRADPDDDRILECAVNGKADLVVSNDRHLLNLKKYAEIPIRRWSGLSAHAWATNYLTHHAIRG
jgi:predicted nucleic acid-binding protein